MARNLALTPDPDQPACPEAALARVRRYRDTELPDEDQRIVYLRFYEVDLETRAG